MNRTKKYLKSKGYKFDEDYPWLPYEDGPVTLEETRLNINDGGVYIAVIYTSITAVYQLGRDGVCRKVDTYKAMELIEQESFDEDDDYYTPSSTAGDYGPSNPWDAPGMSISDFI